MKKLLFGVLLSSSLIFTACEKSSDVDLETAVAQKVKDPEPESLNWDEIIDHDCADPGYRCAVIRPTDRQSTDIGQGNWRSLFNNGKNTLGLPPAVVQQVIDGKLSVYPKARGGKMQIRIK